ncbi:hypothetical protein AYI68_g6028 [Smittium mucronatum]|uniref:Uncharacterized protein n=1 Tax=Smittium mucronatum TaxID=133383 RepID=A0A1R0GSL3_9FUNG|nr:hypothetical protein AYI68_g6028 [Smittium mucronatum]
MYINAKEFLTILYALQPKKVSGICGLHINQDLRDSGEDIEMFNEDKTEGSSHVFSISAQPRRCSSQIYSSEGRVYIT